MSVYNGADYLKESVQSILDQSYQDFEFLIVDDCSTDASLSLLKSFEDPRMNIVENESNLGLTKSLNKAIALCRGNYIARQDADDISCPDRFLLQLEFLKKHPEVALVGSQCQIIDENSNEIASPTFLQRPTDIWAIRWMTLYDSPFIHPSVMMNKDIIWGELQGYDENYRTNQDYELWSRLVYKYETRNLNESLLRFRVHKASVSANYSQESYEKVIAIYNHAVKQAFTKPNSEMFIALISAINSGKTFQARSNLRALKNEIDKLYEKFIEEHQITSDRQAGLALERDRLFMRSAYYLTRAHKSAAWILFRAAFRGNRKMTYPYLLRFFIKMLIPNR